MLVLDEVAVTEVDDGSFVDDTAPRSGESPHDPTDNTTIRPNTKPVHRDGKEQSVMRGS